MEYDVEKKAEELLAAVGMELSKSREKYADSVLDGKEIPLFAEPPVEKHRRKMGMKRMAILAAVMILVMGLCVTSVAGFREKISNLFSQKGDVSTELTSLEKQNFEGQVPDIEAGYLPEGYQLEWEDDEEFCLSKLYVRGEDEYIHLAIQESSSFTVSVDNETMKQEMTRVNVYQAQLFYRDKESYIAWQVGDFVISVTGTVSKEDVLKVAEGVCLGK